MKCMRRWEWRESGKVGGREREKVGGGESGKVRWGERVDGIRGLEQREVAEIRVERSGTQSVCEYGVFDTKQKVLDIRTLRFWRSQDAFIRTRNGLFRNAGKAFRADGRGFMGT